MKSTLILSSLLIASAAMAAEDLPDGLVQADVIGGWTTGTGTRMAALHLTLAPGWKTYWRAPGDAGIPPTFDWTGSTNLAGVSFHWPRPEVFDLSGLRTLGYLNELILPIELTPARKGAPVLIEATVQLGVCKEVCVPVSLTVRAQIPGNAAQDPAIRAALDDQPERLDATVRCAVQPIRDGLRLTATADVASAGTDEFAVIEMADASAWVSAAVSERSGGQLVSIADLVPPSAAPFTLDRSQVRITLFGNGHAVEMTGCTG